VASGRTAQQDATRQRLDATAWIRAALDLMAEAGLAAVAVEPLARRLGTTKGSFYWHFPNRDALVIAVLDHWRDIATQAVIDLLEATPDPLDRLRRLAVITNRSAWEDRLEYAILSAADDPLVRPSVEAVNTERLAYVVRIFRDLGYPKAIAERRAAIVLHAYVGRLRMDHGRPRPSRSQSTAYNRELVALLTADRPGT
jgi:AcrR family transcriptional regulator